MRKIAFIDRDGTLINEPTPEETTEGEVPYQIDSLEKLKLLPGVIGALKKLMYEGYELIMVTNQDDVGSKQFPWKNFELPQQTLIQLLKEEGIEFAEVLVCPHSPDANCECRKPKLGLIKNSDYDPSTSIMIGDRNSDGEFARNAGIKFISVETNKGLLNIIK